MGIFSRLSDIVNSNINAILDRAEDPEKIIRLIVQEMEDTLVEARTSAARLIAEKKDIHRRLDKIGEASREWSQRAELALSKDREDLARAALSEKAKLAETAKHMSDELTHLDEALGQSDTDIAKLQAKLLEAKAKQKALVARHENVATRLRTKRMTHDHRVDDALMRFEQIEKKLDHTEALAESYDLGRGKTLAEEIAALESETAVDQELLALKQKMGKN
jgi:phage shock protein A